MQTFINITQWLSDNFFGTPTILLMLVVLVGHLLQKSGAQKTIMGTIKAGIGFLVIQAGSNVITGTLNVFQPMWAEVFGLSETTLGASYMGYDAFVSNFGSAVALCMTCGFLVNVLLARITKFKYIFLTGHELWWVTVVCCGILVNFAPNLSTGMIVLIVSPIIGIYFTIQPAISQKYVRKVTGSDDFALAHPSGIGSSIAGFCGKIFAKNKKDAEEITFPKGLAFLRDNNVITALVMIIVWVIGAVLLLLRKTDNATAIIAGAGAQNFIIYALVQALTFAAGIAVILVGVRMFVSEIIPSFKGISSKLVPDAIPALDAPVLYTYAPNSVILGFLGMFVGIILWMIVLGFSAGFVVVPTMIVLFFHAAVAGIFGNSTGGVKGALLGGFIIATIVAFGQFFFERYLVASTIPDTISWAGETDEFLCFWIFGIIGKLLGR